MAIGVLGPLTIDGDSGRLSPRDRVVLTALAVRPGDATSAERLADAIWGESPPSTWHKVVQGCVVRLRKVLGTRAIETTPQGYRLMLAAEEIDARRFERLLGRGRELIALSEPERAAFVLGEAMELWRGSPLAELRDWDVGRAEAERLAELRRDAEELTVDAALRAGRYREVLGRAQTLVAEAPLRERRWALLALAQYQAGQQAQALRTLGQVRMTLATELGLDPGPDLVALGQAILRQDPSLVVATALPQPSAACPYQGLVPYGVGDGDAFYGRERDVAECLGRLAVDGVLVVVGPSGSGKSSLVRAGVGAALERDARRVVVITPGVHPVDSLTVLRSSGPRPVLIVDQCEEAVSLCESAVEQARFFRLLAEHARAGQLVVALRADRIGETSAHPEFARLVEQGLFLLGPMGPDQLRGCIEGPAHHAGLLLEPGLIDLLVREVEGEPGALPLLSHALRETWGHREGRTLTVAGYRETGGIREAVARSAEKVYGELEANQRPIVRNLLLRLVARSGDGEPVPNRVPRRLVADDLRHTEVIEKLVSARLVTSDDGVLELAHEALVRAWSRLKQWLDDDADGQRIMRHLSAAADAWDSMRRPESELYRGARLVQALDWQQGAETDLTLIEVEFLTRSKAQGDLELQEARHRVETEARGRQRTRRLAAGLAAALVLAIVAAGFATWFQKSANDRASEADAASTVADANRLAALSKSVGSLDLSLLLAAEALRTASTPATQDGLLASLIQHRRAIQVTQLKRRPTDGELSNAGETLFVAHYNGVIGWDVGSTTRPREVVDWSQPPDIAGSSTEDLVALSSWKDDETVRVGVFAGDGSERLLLEGEDEIGGFPIGLGFNPDGRRLLIVVQNNTAGKPGAEANVLEVDAETGDRVRSHRVRRSLNDEAEFEGMVADDGSTAVVWTRGSPSTATTLDLASGVRRSVHVWPRPSPSLGFVPLPTGVAQRWDDGAVTLYDHRGQATQALDLHDAKVNDLVVSPDGTWAATADDGGQVIVWTVHPRTGLWSRRESLIGHDGGVSGVMVGPRGKTLVTVSHDGTAISWDLSAGAGFGTPAAGPRNRWISNRPQVITPGGLVVAPTRPAPAAAEENSGPEVAAMFLDSSAGEVVDQVFAGRTLENLAYGSSVSVSPEGSKVAVTYGYGTVVLDTRTREEVARIELDEIDELGDRLPELVWSSVWTPDGARLLLAAEGKMFDPVDGGLVIVDTATWRVHPERIDLGGSAQTMEVSPDREWLAVGMSTPPVENAPSGSLQILDANSLVVKRTVSLGPGAYPNDISFSPDGRLVAAGDEIGNVSVFDVVAGQRLGAPTKVHNESVQQVEWLPDGRTVVSSGADGMVSLFDAERGLVRASMPGSASASNAYTYLTSVTSRSITALTGGSGGRSYPLDTERWLDYACVVAGRDLTRDEWSSYLPGRQYRRTCSDRS